MFHSINWSFKGKRKYIHSTDLFSDLSSVFIEKGVDKETLLHVNFKKLISFKPKIIFPLASSDLSLISDPHCFANFKLPINGQDKHGVLLKTDELVFSKKPDFEKLAFEHSKISGAEIFCPAVLPNLAAIDVIIAAAKCFHRETFNRDAFWLVKGFQLPLDTNQVGPGTLKLKVRTMASRPFSLITCYHEDRKLGQIQFGAIENE
jgi:hypothetical protein